MRALLVLLLSVNVCAAGERPLMFDDIPPDTVANSAFQNCWKTADPTMSKEYTGRYCACAAERLEKSLSKEDLAELNSHLTATTSSTEQLIIRLRLRQIADYCNNVSK